MTENELKEENKQLKERIKYLEGILNRGNAGNTSAYNAIRLMIIEKVQKEVELPKELEDWKKESYIQAKERQLMSDLKWEIRVRRTSEFRTEHIKQAEEYIQDYEFEKIGV